MDCEVVNSFKHNDVTGRRIAGRLTHARGMPRLGGVKDKGPSAIATGHRIHDVPWTLNDGSFVKRASCLESSSFRATFSRLMKPNSHLRNRVNIVGAGFCFQSARPQRARLAANSTGGFVTIGPNPSPFRLRSPRGLCNSVSRQNRPAGRSETQSPHQQSKTASLEQVNARMSLAPLRIVAR